MGYGGALTILNGSPFDWMLTGQHSYQMDKWSWPTIRKASRILVEFGTRGNTRDDAAEAYYSAGTQDKFTILAQKPSDYKITISLNNMSTKQSPRGSNIDLGFRHDAAVNWIMSTDQAGQWWSNSGTYTDWMQQSMGSLANRTLKHICMPGSHDAGMSVFRPGTIGAHFANTQTQYLDFYRQLMAGSRFFDLRPVLSNGQWVAGHYSAIRNDIEDIWVGGNGQSITDIVRQLNDFTAQYKELVIINLSHTLDTDNKYKDLTQDQWNGLMDTFKGINNRYTTVNPHNVDLSSKALGDFITDRASVLLIAQLPGGISLGDYANQGFYSGKNFPFYDSYSNTNKNSGMKADQLSKLRQSRNLVSSPTDRRDRFHILSWTLTQQPEDVLNFDRAIMNIAAEVFDDLVSEAWNAFTPECFPNVLFVDALGIRDKSVVFPYDKPRSVSVNNDIAALAIAVNNGMAGRNSYITGQ
ncbi:PLC-like phosphodiesterase [Pyrenochaeta sp. MPI-SDFR-AT-0127]|nr:PLC-like phosphodiesterase [Pyrenochaeta sp. MPI-SDFR-AT-0127]